MSRQLSELFRGNSFRNGSQVSAKAPPVRCSAKIRIERLCLQLLQESDSQSEDFDRDENEDRNDSSLMKQYL